MSVYRCINLLALGGVLLLSCGGSASAQNAYIANELDNTVSVINTSTNTVIATVPAGVRPFGVAVSPAGTLAYVTNSGDNTVSVINTSTNTVTAIVPVGGEPLGVAVNPAGTFAYVANNGSNNVSVINTATNTVAIMVPVGTNPSGVAVSPGGTLVYVANINSNNISVISTASNIVTATVPVGSNPYGVAVNPAGTYVYVANQSDSTVSVINTATNTVTATVPVGGLGHPVGIAVNPGGTFVYAANVSGSNVSVINTSTNAVTATVAVGGYPTGVTVNRAGTFAYVTYQTNSNAGYVSVINTATNTVTATVPVGTGTASFGQFIQPPATMALSQTTLNYGVGGGVVTDPQNVTVSFSGGAMLNWTASSNQSNVVVSPTSGTGRGTLTITASAGPSAAVTVTAAGAAGSPQTIAVNIANVTPSAPFGSLDTPVTTGNPTFAGAIAVTGWALDAIEVTGVDIWREPVTGETGTGLIFIGNAAFLAGARPDVQAYYPNYPLSNQSGWGYLMLTNGLPNSSGSGPTGNGIYKLHAIAYNKTGLQTDLGIKTITVDNADSTLPFGTLDTPLQGQTVSGLVTNFGWAVTPSITGCPVAKQPCIIPRDGSTIVVYVDSLPTAHPVYNIDRCDISQSFPNPPYANSGSPNCANNGMSPGPIGYYYLDTTTLSNGIHTITWSVTDNAGRAVGIGARYFTVAN